MAEGGKSISRSRSVSRSRSRSSASSRSLSPRKSRYVRHRRPSSSLSRERRRRHEWIRRRRERRYGRRRRSYSRRRSPSRRRGPRFTRRRRRSSSSRGRRSHTRSRTPERRRAPPAPPSVSSKSEDQAPSLTPLAKEQVGIPEELTPKNLSQIDKASPPKEEVVERKSSCGSVKGDEAEKDVSESGVSREGSKSPISGASAKEEREKSKSPSRSVSVESRRRKGSSASGRMKERRSRYSVQRKRRSRSRRRSRSPRREHRGRRLPYSSGKGGKGWREWWPGGQWNGWSNWGSSAPRFDRYGNELGRTRRRSRGLYGWKAGDGTVVKDSNFQDEADKAFLEPVKEEDKSSGAKRLLRVEDTLEEDSRLALLQRDIEAKLEALRARKKAIEATKAAASGTTTKCEEEVNGQ